MSKIDELARIMATSSNMVFFGGAGMSTESGIPDFRSADGIYSQKLNREFSPEEMVSHTFLCDHPHDFFDFFFAKMVFLDAKPNAGHYALADLESKGKLLAVVTQNIDGLHQSAGSESVCELCMAQLCTGIVWTAAGNIHWNMPCKTNRFLFVKTVAASCGQMWFYMKKHSMNG